MHTILNLTYFREKGLKGEELSDEIKEKFLLKSYAWTWTQAHKMPLSVAIGQGKLACLTVDGHFIYARRIVKYGSPEYYEAVTGRDRVLRDIILCQLFADEEIPELHRELRREFDGDEEDELGDDEEFPLPSQPEKIEVQLQLKITPDLLKRYIWSFGVRSFYFKPKITQEINKQLVSMILYLNIETFSPEW